MVVTAGKVSLEPKAFLDQKVYVYKKRVRELIQHILNLMLLFSVIPSLSADNVT